MKPHNPYTGPPTGMKSLSARRLDPLDDGTGVQTFPKSGVVRSPLGEFLLQKRLEHGWTLAYAAEKCGIHTCHLGHLECGYHHPRPPTTRRICRGLGIDEAELFRVVEHSQKTFGRCKKVTMREKGAYLRMGASTPRKVWEWVEHLAASHSPPIPMSQMSGKLITQAYIAATGDKDI